MVSPVGRAALWSIPCTVITSIVLVALSDGHAISRVVAQAVVLSLFAFTISIWAAWLVSPWVSNLGRPKK